MFPEHMTRGKKTNKHFEIKSGKSSSKIYRLGFFQQFYWRKTIVDKIGSTRLVVAVVDFLLWWWCNKFGLNCSNKKLKTK